MPPDAESRPSAPRGALGAFHRVMHGVNVAVMVAAGLVLAGQVILLVWHAVQGIWQVGPQMDWISEVVEFAILQVAFLGAAVALRRRAHQGIDALVLLLPPRVRHAIDAVNWVLLAGFGLFFAHRGLLYVLGVRGEGGMLAVAPLPQWPFYVCFPIMGVLVACFSIEGLLTTLGEGPPPRREAPSAPRRPDEPPAPPAASRAEGAKP